MIDRHRTDAIRALFLLAAAIALAALIFLTLSRDAVFPPGRAQLLSALIFAAALAAGSRRVRDAARATLARSRRVSPATWTAVSTSPGRWLLYTLWFVAVTSLGEIAYLTYTKEVTEYRVLSFVFMWRIPLGYALVFGLVGVIWLVTRGRPWAVRVPLFVSFFITACGWLPVVVRGIHGWAVVLLGAGIAVQLTRLARTHLNLFDRLVRSTVAAATVVTVSLAVGFSASAVLTERQARARLPATATDGPNVLLIVLDTVRARSLSLYGYQRATSPNLERFARRGVVFDRAYATAPWTLPSHASIFTGRYPHELSTGFANPLDATYPTLAEALAEYGYLTSAFVANTWYAGAEYGLGRGFVRYDVHETTPTTSFMSTAFGALVLGVSRAKYHLENHDNFGRKSAEDINRSFLSWLSTQGTDRPFFTFLNYCDAHDPYLPPEPYALRFSDTRPQGHVTAKPLAAWSPGEIQELNDAYDGAIAYLDEQVGRLLDTLDARGILNETIVIVTADHGEHFGEHNLLDHVYSLYLPLLHVPLLVLRPDGIDGGRRIGEPVSLRDVAATVFALSGLDNRAGIPGTPLLPRTNDAGSRILLAEVQRLIEDGVPEWYPARRGHMKSVMVGDWQYIRNFGDGKEELFNVLDDPGNLRNLAAHDGEKLAEYRGYLERVLSASGRRTTEAGRK